MVQLPEKRLKKEGAAHLDPHPHTDKAFVSYHCITLEVFFGLSVGAGWSSRPRAGSIAIDDGGFMGPNYSEDLNQKIDKAIKASGVLWWCRRKGGESQRMWDMHDRSCAIVLKIGCGLGKDLQFERWVTF